MKKPQIQQVQIVPGHRNATGEAHFVGEQQVDLRSITTQTLSLNARARSVVLRFDPDPQGNISGSVNVYINGNNTGLPWQTLTPTNSPVCRPIPAAPIGTIITLIPNSGSMGIVTVTETEDVQGVR